MSSRGTLHQLAGSVPLCMRFGPSMTIHVDRLEVQFGLAHDCIRACVYCNYIAHRKSARPAWQSIMDMCYADALITWNQLFGSDSQHAHWKGFTALLPIPAGGPLKPFGKEVICNYIGINEEQWSSYHTSMVRTRNNWLAHFDHRLPLADLPNLTWALHSAYIYRAWLLELLKGYRAQGHAIVIDETPGDMVLKMFEEQIAEICI